MSYEEKDKCQVCHGERGGVPGNENRVEKDGKTVIMCDYCHADELQETLNRQEYLQAERATLKRLLAECEDSDLLAKASLAGRLYAVEYELGIAP
jgi:superfamily II helicase